MAGRIDSIATRVGDHFRKGDVLVTFDRTVPRAQLAREQAVVTQVERTYEINRRAVAQKSTGQLELDIAAADVLKAKADLAAAESVASRCRIAAPFAGMTVEQKAHEFEYGTPGQPMLAVLDDRALEVELTAPSRWLSSSPGRHCRSRSTTLAKLFGPNYPARRPGRTGQPIVQGNRRKYRRFVRSYGRHERPRHRDAAVRQARAAKRHNQKN